MRFARLLTVILGLACLAFSASPDPDPGPHYATWFDHNEQGGFQWVGVAAQSAAKTFVPGGNITSTLAFSDFGMEVNVNSWYTVTIHVEYQLSAASFPYRPDLLGFAQVRWKPHNEQGDEIPLPFTLAYLTQTGQWREATFTLPAQQGSALGNTASLSFHMASSSDVGVAFTVRAWASIN